MIFDILDKKCKIQLFSQYFLFHKISNHTTLIHHSQSLAMFFHPEHQNQQQLLSTIVLVVAPPLFFTLPVSARTKNCNQIYVTLHAIFPRDPQHGPTHLNSRAHFTVVCDTAWKSGEHCAPRVNENSLTMSFFFHRLCAQIHLDEESLPFTHVVQNSGTTNRRCSRRLQQGL